MRWPFGFDEWGRRAVPRLTIRLNEQMTDAVNELSHAERLPRTEIVLRAIALYEFVQRATSQGRDVRMRTDDNGAMIVVLLVRRQLPALIEQ
jgi:predicted transcriptional regulator